MGDVIEGVFTKDEDDDITLLDSDQFVTLVEILISQLDDDGVQVVSFGRMDDDEGYFTGYVLYIVDFDNPEAGFKFLRDDEKADHLKLFKDLNEITDWLYERVEVEWISIRGQI